MKTQPALPWIVSSTHNGQAYDIGAADAANVALVYGPKDGGPEGFKENARVMAKAYEMRALLQEIYLYQYGFDTHDKVKAILLEVGGKVE